MGTKADSKETRRRLIEAAGALFAEHGPHGVGVRQIINKTRTHLSAINYHFGDKDGLYRACIAAAFESPSFDSIKEPDYLKTQPAELLRKVVRALLKDYRQSPAQSWRARLATHVMRDPDEKLQTYIAELVKPRFSQLVALFRALAAEGTPAARIELAILSMVGQIESVHEAGQLLNHIAPHLTEAAKRPRWLEDTIVQNTLAVL